MGRRRICDEATSILWVGGCLVILSEVAKFFLGGR